MSTSYDVRCVDCGENHGFYYATRMGDMMIVIARLGPKLAEVGRVVAELRGAEAYGDVQLKLDYDRLAVNFDWFAKHGTHHLVCVDEYGHCHDECGEYFRCGECGHQKMCRRTKGHKGDHAADRLLETGSNA